MADSLIGLTSHTRSLGFAKVSEEREQERSLSLGRGAFCKGLSIGRVVLVRQESCVEQPRLAPSWRCQSAKSSGGYLE